MHPSCEAPGRHAAGRQRPWLGALAPAGACCFFCAFCAFCAGCTDNNGTATGSAWTLAGLFAVALLASALAYALGALRERRRSERSLRETRAELRTWQQLGEGWHWQTDSAHRLTLWQGPGRGAVGECALFDARQAALLARLRGMQAFNGLKLVSHPPAEGVTAWALRGVPRHDDLGAFAGFIGSAQPLDGTAALAADAAALPALLNAWPGPALLAWQSADGGWRVEQSNAAARGLWPALQGPSDLSALAAQLPPAAAAALRDALAGSPTAAVLEGWHVERFSAAVGDPTGLQALGGTAGAVGLLLAQQAGADAGSTAVQAGESDNFSFTASHDLRAPIRVVEGFTRIVKEDYGHLLDRVGNDHLDRVLGAAARMNLMIDALLTLARLSSQPLARQPVNLSQLAAFIVDDLRRSAPGREADIDIEPGLAAVGDPTLLRLVLENLLGNAWKYSGRAERTQISLRTVPHDSGRAYVVRDNGAGFDMRSADRLFGLFQRLHSASDFPGHGVGLASVRRIVNRHGGDIWAEAEPGRGAAFFFTLAGC
jgi:signal transduction histidine kinase